MLNHPGQCGGGAQNFEIASGKKELSKEVEQAKSIMLKTYPQGSTPLTKHIYELRAAIATMKDDLEVEGKKVVVVLATDGIPTDTSRNGFVQSLRSLEKLPVWLVIRLSTNEEDVIVSYFEAYLFSFHFCSVH